MSVRQPGLQILKSKLAIFNEIETTRPLTSDEKAAKAQVLDTLSKAADA